MSLYTKFGDQGKTMLFGGATTRKSDPRIHAYGTVDELSSILGLVVAEIGLVGQGGEEGNEGDLVARLKSIQRMLHRVGADLATPAAGKVKVVRVAPQDVLAMERWIDEAESKVPPLSKFILPGGSKIGALLNVARTVCRRAERWVVELTEKEEVNAEVVKYLNRLGDYLFAASRIVNQSAGAGEEQV